MTPELKVVSHGRSGLVHYREGRHTHTFDWELGGGDVIMVVYVPTPAAWDAAVPWAARRRTEVLERLARALCRQQCPRGRYELADQWIHVREPRPPWRVVGDWLARRRLALPALLALALGAGCQRSGPIHATAALPAPGELVPTFAFREARTATAGRDSVRSADLRGAPTLLALWSTYCPHQGPAMAAFARLAADYRAAGVRVVVLADDAASPALRQALDTLAWARAVDQVGSAGGRLDRHFDRSAAAPERAEYRVEFVLPAFLLLDAEGRFVRRAFGPADVWFRPALDSLLARTAPGAT